MDDHFFNDLVGKVQRLQKKNYAPTPGIRKPISSSHNSQHPSEVSVRFLYECVVFYF